MDAVTPTRVWPTAVTAIVTSLLIAGVLPTFAAEVVLGMAGPLLVTLGSLLLLDRTHRRGPQHLTRMLVRSFLCKMVVFGVYITVAITVLALDPVAFVASFTVYFVALHLTEAVHLQRRLATGPSSS